jgi:hypothetical protein
MYYYQPSILLYNKYNVFYAVVEHQRMPLRGGQPARRIQGRSRAFPSLMRTQTRAQIVWNDNQQQQHHPPQQGKKKLNCLSSC